MGKSIEGGLGYNIMPTFRKLPQSTVTLGNTHLLNFSMRVVRYKGEDERPWKVYLVGVTECYSPKNRGEDTPKYGKRRCKDCREWFAAIKPYYVVCFTCYMAQLKRQKDEREDLLNPRPLQYR